jgi:hypothetical protein
MLSQIEEFVNWIHRRNPEARTWRDYNYDLPHGAERIRQEILHLCPLLRDPSCAIQVGVCGPPTPVIRSISPLQYIYVSTHTTCSTPRSVRGC